MLQVLIHDGKSFSVKIDGRIAKITLLGSTVEFAWDEYYSEAEMQALTPDKWWSWGTELGCDAGVIAYSEMLEQYVNADEQWDLEAEADQEARWEADHIRQESRQDLFI